MENEQLETVLKEELWTTARFAAQVMEQDGHHVPMLLVDAPDGRRLVIGCPQAGPMDVWRQNVRAVLEELAAAGARQVIWIVEGWAVLTATDEARAQFDIWRAQHPATSLEHYPNRAEVLLVTVARPEGRVTGQCRIQRDADGTLQVGEPTLWEMPSPAGGIRMEDRFFDALPCGDRP